MDSIDRITRALELTGIMSTSEIAEHASVPFNECENILIEMEELAQVVSVSDCEWQLM